MKHQSNVWWLYQIFEPNSSNTAEKSLPYENYVVIADESPS